MRKVLAATGGGIRGIAHIGVIDAGIQKNYFPHYNKLDPTVLDFADMQIATNEYSAFCGDSSASLIMAMVANGWSIGEMVSLVTGTNFKDLFTLPFIPWTARLAAAPFSRIKLTKFARFIDSLDFRLEYADKLFVNSWDGKNNQHVIFCQKKPDWALDFVSDAGHNTDGTHRVVWYENAFSELGYGTVLTRSMALPGLVADDERFEDGGVCGHPPIWFVPRDADVTVIDLGYADLEGNKHSKDLISSVTESYNVAASYAQRRLLKEFTNLKKIQPEIYDVSSTDFALNADQKAEIIARAYQNTRHQF